MRALSVLTLVGCAWFTLGSTASADVQISIRDGQVSIAAKDATVRQILTEWARVGRTNIVNVERIPGASMTIELKNVPEKDALDMLLRSISGYIAAPRAPFVSDASLFDRIIVLPTSAAPNATATSSGPPPFSLQTGLPLSQGTEDDELRAGIQPPPRGPIFNTFPQPQVANPQRQGAPAATPGAVAAPPQQQPFFLAQPPVIAPQTPASSPTPSAQPSAPAGAVSTPGMIAPAPAQQPGQVVQPR
jgi:hypothetical protein